MKKNSFHPSREKGIAVLFSLGILGLMSVLALTFASVTLSDKKAAQSSADGISADFIANTALNRAIAVLDYNYSQKTLDKPYFASSKSTTHSNDDYDWVWKIFSRGIDVMDAYYNENTITSVDQYVPTWQYIKNTANNNEILGRAAFLLQPLPVFDATCFAYKSDGTAASATRDRQGISTSEFFKEDLPGWSGAGFTFPVLASPAAERYHSYDEFKSGVAATAADAVKDPYSKILTKWFGFPSCQYREAFYYDKDGKKLFHRFPLVRSDWDEFNVEDLWNKDKLQEYSATCTEVGSRCIPYIADMVANAATATQGKQLAANFVAYFSKIPGTAGGLTTRKLWDNLTDPTYTANFRTPYLSEVLIKVKFTIQRDPAETNPGGTPLTYEFYLVPSITVEAEAFDYYSSNKNVALKMDGTIDVSYTKVSGSGSSSLSDAATVYALSKGSDNFYYKSQTFDLAKIPLGAAVAETTFTVSPVSFKLSKLVLHSGADDSGVPIDFAKLDTSKTVSFPSAIGADGSVEAVFSAQASDLRNNLAADSWQYVVEESAPAKEYGTIGKKNAENSAVTDSDNDDRWAPSTAYMQDFDTSSVASLSRNVSPWEIGMISRGSVYQTINLQKLNDSAYDLNEHTHKSSTDFSYSKGDANILDQIKTVKADTTYEYGKINVNDVNQMYTADHFKPLFNVPLERSKREPQAVSYSNFSTLFTNLSGAFQANGRYYSRVEWLKNGTFSGYFVDIAQQDAGREELIGKTFSLLAADGVCHRAFVVCLGQQIKDVGGVGSDVNFYRDWNENGTFNNPSTDLGRYNAGYMSISGTAMPEKTTSGTVPAQIGRYDNGADKILATRKVKAIVYFDSNVFKWKVWSVSNAD